MAMHPARCRAETITKEGPVRKFVFAALILCCAAGVGLSAAMPAVAQQEPDGGMNPKAAKTYGSAMEFARKGLDQQAFGLFEKADKQDGGQCSTCQVQVIHYGIEFHDWKTAQRAAQEELAEAHDKRDVALARFDLGHVLFEQALLKHKQEIFIQSHVQLVKALTAYPNFPDAMFLDGRVLAELHHDDAAKAEFATFLKMAQPSDLDRGRAERYLSNIQLAREKMAPAFAFTTLRGRHVSLDDLHGKVVLLDFWASWCEPCREALPNIQKIAKKFQGQPLVILSISLDSDPQAWANFVEKHHMTWLQYRDGMFNGPIARLFGVQEIPQTFTIDANGVLRADNVGESSIEGRLKKLVAQAVREDARQTAQAQ
jgi:thiol-disulfide isomerase/thioredoxin